MIACKCGSTTFYRAVPCRGIWQEYLKLVNGELIIEESYTDGIEKYGTPKTIRCVECKKRHPNPDL